MATSEAVRRGGCITESMTAEWRLAHSGTLGTKNAPAGLAGLGG